MLATADAGWLSDAVEEWPADARIVVCNVAGAEVAHGIKVALGIHHRDVHSFVASASCCGVTNTYEQPEQLGADRWAALLGAHALQVELAAPCLVVCAGTATTVDHLAADGCFRGGVILPGFDLMRSALAGNTAQLPLAEGEYRAEPRNTMDAIVSGCLNAQLGAIERMFASIAGVPGARCLMTGGGVARLQTYLSIPVQVEENLILQGLVRYGASR